MTKLFQIFLAGFLLLTAAAHACNSPQSIVAPCAPRVASESRGDELDAKGDYYGAFEQYTSMWSTHQTLEQFEVKHGSVTPQRQENLERLMKKVASTLEKIKPPPTVSAPWVADYHYNLAKSQKSAGQLSSALKTLRFADILAKGQQESMDILALRAEIEAMLEIENRR